MSGRELFARYNKLIHCLIVLTNCFPRKLRTVLLSGTRMWGGKIGMIVRYILASTLCKECGSNVAIFPGVYFKCIEKLSLGSNISIHEMCYIDASGEVEIGDDVSIAHRCTILSSNHRYSDVVTPIKYQGMILKKSVIENNVWIGCGCVILGGIHIASGCVVGANSTITHSTPPQYSINWVCSEKRKVSFETGNIA